MATYGSASRHPWKVVFNRALWEGFASRNLERDMETYCIIKLFNVPAHLVVNLRNMVLDVNNVSMVCFFAQIVSVFYGSAAANGI